MAKSKLFLLITFAVICAIVLVLGIVVVCGIEFTEMLPRDGLSQNGLSFLRENFGIGGDAFVVVEGTENDSALRSAISKIKKFDGVSKLLWYGDASSINTILSFLPSLSGTVRTDEITSYLREKIGEKYYYKILIVTDYMPASKETKIFQKKVFNLLNGELKRETEISGMTALTKRVSADVGIALIAGGAAALVSTVFVILFLSKKLKLRTVKNKTSGIIGIVSLALIIPLLVLSCFGNLSFFDLYKPQKGEIKKIAEQLQNQLVLAVPLTPEKDEQADYHKELVNLNVDYALGACTALKVDQSFLNIIASIGIPPLDIMFSEVDGKYYTMYLIGIKSINDYAVLEEIKTLSESYFDDYYAFGLLTANYDLKSSAPKFIKLFLVAAAILASLIIGFLAVKPLSKKFALICLILLSSGFTLALTFIAGAINYYSLLIGIGISFVLSVTSVLAAINGERETQTAAFLANVCIALITGISALCVKNTLLIDAFFILAAGAAATAVIILLVKDGIVFTFNRIFGTIRNGKNEKAKNG